MGTCVVLILLAWNVVRLFSTTAAVVMSLVAAVINWNSAGIMPMTSSSGFDNSSDTCCSPPNSSRVRRVASSRRQLQRAYSEIGSTTFREHLTAVRMERAAELLRIRGLTVRDVAHRVGYRQPAQFAKAFRRHHGIAPSDFRANGRFSRLGAVSAAPNNAAA